MSLYREAGRGRARSIVIAAVIALLVGGGIGFAIGRSTAPEPSPAEIGAQLREQLRPVKSGIVLLPNEYAQAYKGEGVELEGVTGALDRIEKQLIVAAPDLRALDPRGVEQVSLALSRLKTAVKQKASPAEVKQLVDRLSTTVEALPGA